MINLLSLSEIFRVLLYFIIGLTYAFLAYAYYFGFKNVRTSPIIKSLANMFFWSSIVFFYLSFVPIFKIAKADLEHTILTNSLTFFLIPLAYCTYSFFRESFKKQTAEPIIKSKSIKKKESL